MEDAEGDLIEDDSPTEIGGQIRGPQNTSRNILDRRKRPLLIAENIHASQKSVKSSGGVGKFRISNNAKSEGREVRPQQPDRRPWAERYGPTNLDELAVNKRKVSDVHSWLEKAMHSHDRKKILILKGPAGAGKTATVSNLAKAMHFELLDWSNPAGSQVFSAGYSSMSAQFEEFLGRGGRFNALSFDDIARLDNEKSPPPENATQQKVILLEEFPNTFLSSSAVLHSFRSNILQYLSLSTLFREPFLSTPAAGNVNVIPIVMVITESRMGTNAAACDSFTAHRLLGSEILSHPSTSTIEFNAMAPTFIAKALDLVIQKEARQSGRRRIPGPSLLKQLGEVGDVRSAIGSLEFLCLRAADNDDWGGSVASRAKKGVNASALTQMERASLEMVTHRESSLGLFHAVGKVVYNKRDDVPIGNKSPEQPPDHLLEHRRPRISQLSVDQLIDETGTETGTFISALHENYVLSCEGPSTLESLNGCIEALSDSDLLLSPRGFRLGSYSSQVAATDVLRQDEISFHVAVRGLLFALPDPVKRPSHPLPGKESDKGGAYKMFYPTSIRLSRQMEEIDGLIDRWNDRLRVGNISLKRSGCGDGQRFAALKLKGFGRRGEDVPRSSNDEHSPVRKSLGCTRIELVRERLPFMTRIAQRSAVSTHLGELEKITQFHGINTPSEETSDDEDTAEGVPAVSARSQGGVDRIAEQPCKGAETIVLPVEEEVGMLYLTDDDIED